MYGSYPNDNNTNRASVAPIGFELLESEFQTSFNNVPSSYNNDSNSAYPPVYNNYGYDSNQYNGASNYSYNNTSNTTFNQWNVPNYQPLDQYNSNITSDDTDINMASLPVHMREALDGLVKNNFNENFIASQDFQTIKTKFTRSNRFVDNEFRATNDSIFFTRKFRDYLQTNGKFPYRSNQIEWKRAKDLYANQAHFVLDKQNRFIDLKRVDHLNYKNLFHTTDLDQGALGNCWFISAATGIIQNYTLFKRVVPFDNSFEDSEYNGAFHFRFWIYGTWKDVVVDDFLPVGPDNRLIFSKNRETPNEFWCALFEKAYAKVCGSYEALDGGFTSDALIDMSGGIEEIFDLKQIRRTLHGSIRNDDDKLNHSQFWEVLINARKKQSVIGSNIELLETDSVNEVKLHNGLVRGHAYICTKLAELVINGQNQRIMRLYNPWGNEVEWNGKWSDNSTIWRSVDPNVKEKLELKIDKDGEFWMSFEDFVTNFDFCQLCNLTPHINSDISTVYGQNSRSLSNIFSMWQCQIFHGQWVNGVSSGGRGDQNRAKFWTNPQIAFNINQSDIVKDNSCWVIIGLMQKYTRQKRVALQVDSAEEYIQFRIYKIRDSAQYFSGAQIDSRDLERLGSSGAYVNKREVTARFNLTPGAYIVVPSCYDEDIEGELLVRIFTEMPLNQKECKALNSNNRIRSSSIDQGLANDLRNLSLGASSVVNSFAQSASDFSRRNNLDNNSNNAGKRNKPQKPQISCNQM